MRKDDKKYHVSFDIKFRKNPYRGLYIAIEGIDGSGKTTQVEKLKEYFEKKGKAVITTREPRKKSGIFAQLIRNVLALKVKIPAVAFQYLFSADRVINHEETVIPSLKQGKIIVSDRCFWSAVTYGIVDWMIGKGKISSYKIGEIILCAQSILSMYHQFIVPDHTFYLRISIDTALKRLSKMGKTKEIYETRDKLVKTTEGYEWLVKKFPREITVINGEQAVKEVTEDILGKL